MIKILDKQIADKIAAGEVIERPVSIIKELVENSIDAGADSIIVEIKKGGKAYIRVTDNGCGIAKNDVETAFLRHATSKISTAKDLEAIDTLGFRGEALASVCAVTRTELLTKEKNDKTGTRLIIHGGEILSNTSTGCPDGTTIIITDLFYNTPARLKFMKNDSAESSMIIDFMSQMALAYSNIAFRFINNGNVIFSTIGDSNRLNIISRVFPNIDTPNLTEIKYEKDGLSLSGYISTPSMSRASRNGQIYFVNGRVVNSKVIDRGVSDGYKERLFEGRHPIVFLFLNIDSHNIDVNIHPNKKEVRFNEEHKIEEFISEAVKKALQTKDSLPKAATYMFKRYEQKNQDINAQIDIKNIMSIESVSTNFVPQFIPQVEVPQVKETCIAEEIEIYSNPSINIEKPIIAPFNFDDLIMKGVIFDTYILATDEDSFYLIDQHAAHERIFYEKLVSEYDNDEKLRQPILMPLLISVDISTNIQDVKWINALNSMGFTIENFGQNSYRISEIPTFMELSEAEDFVKDFTDNISEATDFRNTVVINKIIMKSCKSAVKAHDKLSSEEIDALIKDLKQCVNPFSCPHGRPTFIKLSKYEIERLFKRI